MKTLARVALAAAVLAPSLAVAQPADRQISKGVIAKIGGRDITLVTGQHVMLENHTVINPTGANLRSGITIFITGPTGTDGTIRAKIVDANVNGNHYGDRNGYNFPHQPTPLPAVAPSPDDASQATPVPVPSAT